MEVRFSNSALGHSMSNLSTARKTYGECARRVLQRYGEMQACPDLKSLLALPAIRFAGVDYQGEILSIPASKRTLISIRAILPISKASDSIDYGQVQIVSVTDVKQV